MKYSIVITTYNHLEDCLKPCIESLIKYTDFEAGNVELIVSANGCTDDTEHYLNKIKNTQIPNLKIIWNYNPLGHTKALNAGLKQSTGDYIVCMNNDVVLLEQNKNEWLYKLKDSLNEEYRLVGDQVQVVGYYGKKPIINYCPFYFVMFTKETLDEIGLLDEKFSNVNCMDDIEWCVRLFRNKYKVKSINNKIHHKGSVTVNEFRKNNNINDKWVMDYMMNKHKEIYEDATIKTSIIIPTYNNTDGLIKCINSISKNTSFEETELIIVLNGSGEGIKNYLESFKFIPYLHILYFEEPIGYTRAINEGLKVAVGDYIILLNDDIEILDYLNVNDWVNKLTEPIKQNNKIGITGVHELEFNYTNINFLLFFCVCISRECFNKVGYLDEEFNPGYSEDVDYCIRARQNGFELCNVNTTFDFDNENKVFVGTFPINHYAEKTVHTLDNWVYTKTRNTSYLINKYNLDIKYDKNISVFIPTCTLENIDRALKSIIKNTTNFYLDRFNFIIHCNGENYLNIKNHLEKNFKLNFDFILKQENTYHAQSINECLEYEKKKYNNEYVLVLNDDIVLLDDIKNRWFKLLLLPQLLDKDIAITGPSSSYMKSLDINMIVFFCCLIRKEYFVPLNEEYVKYKSYGDDVEYCYNMTKSGKKLVTVPIWEENKWDNERYSYSTYPIMHEGNGSGARDEKLVIRALSLVFKNINNNILNVCYDNRNFYIKQAFNVCNTFNENDNGKYGFNILDIYLDDDQVDNFYLSNLEQYITQYELIISNLYRVIKNNGKLIINKNLINIFNKYINNSKYKYLGTQVIESEKFNVYSIVKENKNIKQEKEIIMSENTHTKNKDRNISAVITTRGRYFTTLPLAIQSVLNQTLKPKELIIYDDEFNLEKIDLRNYSLYQHLFNMLITNDIMWFIESGKRGGPALNHDLSIERASYDYIWRLDDDEVAENNALEELYNTIISDDTIAAVGSSVLQYDSVKTDNIDTTKIYNKLDRISIDNNIQWVNFDKKYLLEVEHLHSTFLYRKDIAKEVGGYPKTLSEVSHREETIFSHSLKMNDKYKLLVNTNSKVWHYREMTGGIRTNNNVAFYIHDEQVFNEYLQKNNLINAKLNNEEIIIYLDGGIGDHFAFLNVFNILLEKYKDKKFIVANCYPNVFYKYKNNSNIEFISINKSHIRYNKNYLQTLSPYFVGDSKQKNEPNKKYNLIDLYKYIYLGE